MTKNTRAKQRSRKNTRIITLLIALLLFSALAVGGTVAWLTANTGNVANTFTPSNVACSVTENFDGTTKSNVNVTNTGDTEAYIRVKLVTYRVNDDGQHIGGTATIPTFTPGKGWVKYGEYYYYTKPVAANGGTPANPLIGEPGIALIKYDDADGGKQAIEVMAEAIQSKPKDAVESSWNVTVGSDGNLAIE